MTGGRRAPAARRLLAGLLAVGVLATAALTTFAPAVAADDGPDPAATSSRSSIATLRVDRERVGRGKQLAIDGTGWPANTMVVVELCGAGGQEGSAGCDVTSSRSVATFADGRLRAELLVTAPPRPCPCVLHAFVPTATVDLSVPVEILGHPVARIDVATRSAGRIEVAAVAVRAVGPAALSRTREVRVTVVNQGTETVRGVTVDARWGRGAGGDRLVDLPRIEEIPGGGTATTRGRFRLDGWSFGRYTVAADVVGGGGAEHTATTGAPSSRSC